MTGPDPGPSDITAPGGQDAHVRVVRGTPDDDELVALVAGLAAASAGLDRDQDVVGPSGWTDRSRTLPRPPHPAPGVWRWSGRG